MRRIWIIPASFRSPSDLPTEHPYVVDQDGSRAISPWPIGPWYLKSLGPRGRGPEVRGMLGPRPLGPWDLRC